MKSPGRALVMIVVPIVIARILTVFLTSRAGRKTLSAVGQGDLATARGAELVGRYVGPGVASVAGAVDAVRGDHLTEKPVTAAAIATDTAELLLAAGAVVQTFAGFLQAREKLQLATRTDS